MASAETPINTTEVLSRQCTETMKKFLERKSAYPQDTSLKKTKKKTKNGDIIMKREKKSEADPKYITELFEDHRNDYNVMKRNVAGSPLMKRGDKSSNRLRQYTSGTLRSTWRLWNW